MVYQIKPLWISSTYPIAAQQQQQFYQKCTTAAEDCERRLPGSDSRNNNPFAPNLPNPMMVWAHTTSRWRSLTRWTWSLPLRCSSLTLPLRQRNLGIHPLLCSFMCSSCIMIQCRMDVDSKTFIGFFALAFYVFNCYNFSILRPQTKLFLALWIFATFISVACSPFPSQAWFPSGTTILCLYAFVGYVSQCPWYFVLWFRVYHLKTCFLQQLYIWWLSMLAMKWEKWKQ